MRLLCVAAIALVSSAETFRDQSFYVVHSTLPLLFPVGDVHILNGTVADSGGDIQVTVPAGTLKPYNITAGPWYQPPHATEYDCQRNTSALVVANDSSTQIITGFMKGNRADMKDFPCGTYGMGWDDGSVSLARGVPP